MSAEASTTYASGRILVACVGNIFLGDDGFGVEIAKRLAGRRYSDGVEVVDFGIRGVDLAYTLLEGYDTVVLVDAVARGGAAGTLYLIEPEALDDREWDPEATNVALNAHSLDPLRSLRFARALGASPRRLFLLGCEPEEVVAQSQAGVDLDVRVGLSAPVDAALDEAIAMLDALLERLSLANNKHSEG
jgi:hydrogenase maturation protease